MEWLNSQEWGLMILDGKLSGRVQSIVMSIYVCQSVCLSTRMS